MRDRLERQPDWDERFRGWAAKFISKNIWRCDPVDDFKDHMQDAYLMFRHIIASYPEISDPKHIMSLYQRAMINDYNDRARYKQRKSRTEVSIETTLGDDLKLADTLGEANNEGYLNILLGQLPQKVRLAIEALQDKSKLTYLYEIARSAGRVSDVPEKRELSNSTLCKIIGLPKGTDLLEMIYSALLSEDKMSNQVHAVEQELLSITNFVPEKKYRKRQSYLAAIMRAVDALKDDDFERLSDEAVAWVDSAVHAFKAGSDIPDWGATNGNGHAHEDGHEDGMLATAPPQDLSSEVSHSEKPKRGRKAKAAPAEGEEVEVKVKAPRKFKAQALNRWGVAVGTKAAVVCDLISRPGGATMAEIKEATGQTQYNCINRLQRKGHKIVKEGLTISMHEAV